MYCVLLFVCKQILFVVAGFLFFSEGKDAVMMDSSRTIKQNSYFKYNALQEDF